MKYASLFKNKGYIYFILLNKLRLFGFITVFRCYLYNMKFIKPIKLVKYQIWKL